MKYLAAKITFAPTKRFSPWHNLPVREKNSLEQAAFWHEVKVMSCLPTPFLHHFCRQIAIFSRVMEAENFKNTDIIYQGVLVLVQGVLVLVQGVLVLVQGVLVLVQWVLVLVQGVFILSSF